MHYVVATILMWALSLGLSPQAHSSTCSSSIRKLVSTQSDMASSRLSPLKTNLHIKRALKEGPDSIQKEVESARFKSFWRNEIKPRLGALKGRNLRQNKVCRNNFFKNLGLAWSFQSLGYILDARSRVQQGEEAQEIPFAVLANTALLIWVQQEIACAHTLNPAHARLSLQQSQNSQLHPFKRYLKESNTRYKELLLTIPFGVASYTLLAGGEDFTRYNIDMWTHGESDRNHILSREYVKNFINHAFFIGAFESVLFARMSYFNTPFELRWLPRLKALARTRGAKVMAEGAEWVLYRVPMGIADGRVLMWWKDKSLHIIEGVEDTFTSWAGNESEPTP